MNVAVKEPLMPPPSVSSDKLVIEIALSNFLATLDASSLLNTVTIESFFSEKSHWISLKK